MASVFKMTIFPLSEHHSAQQNLYMESEDKVVKQGGRIEKGKGAPWKRKTRMSTCFLQVCGLMFQNIAPPTWVILCFHFRTIKNAYISVALSSTVAWQIDLFRLRYA